MSRTRYLPLVEVTLAVIFWGASFIATKIAVREVSPYSIIWLRFGIGVLILGAAVLQRKQFQRLPLRDLPYFALLGFLAITFHQWLQVNGLVTAQATTTAWIVATTPVFIAILSALFLHERLDLVRIGGIALAAAGVLLVVSHGDLGTLALGRFGEPGDLLIVVSSVNWAVFTVISRRGLNRYPAALMMFYLMLIGWLLNSVLFFTGPGLGELARLDANGWLAIAFLGIFCSGLAYIFWYDALKGLPASRVGVFLYIEPLITLVVAAFILAERVTIASAIGGVIIILGVWLVNRSTRPSERSLAQAQAEEPS
ncbi:MAG: DMT family transporter [Anaerolineae bacterium]